MILSYPHRLSQVFRLRNRIGLNKCPSRFMFTSLRFPDLGLVKMEHEVLVVKMDELNLLPDWMSFMLMGQPHSFSKTIFRSYWVGQSCNDRRRKLVLIVDSPIIAKISATPARRV